MSDEVGGEDEVLLDGGADMLLEGDEIEESLDGEDDMLLEGGDAEASFDGDADELLLEGDALEDALAWTPSAAAVWLSSCPDSPSCCRLWNFFSATSVFGPICPSIGPGLKPLSFSACCAWLTLGSPCDDADCWPIADADCWLDAAVELSDEDGCCEVLPAASTVAEDKAKAAMTRCCAFTCIPFQWGVSTAERYTRPFAFDARLRGRSAGNVHRCNRHAAEGAHNMLRKAQARRSMTPTRGVLARILANGRRIQTPV